MPDASVLSDIKPPADANPRPILTPLAALLGAIESDADARHRAKLSGVPFGPVTGLRRLDDVLGGALTPGLHMVHGSPGIGKTAFALQIAASCGCPALFVTCEMTPIELLRRHTARVTGQFLGTLKDGTLTGQSVVRLASRAAEAAPLLALLDATQAPAPTEEISKATAIVRGNIDAEHFLLVVDSLHSWAEAIGGGESDTDRVAEGVASLRVLAKRLNCPVLAIVERNRASMKNSGQNSGASSRKIEYAAETVIGLDAVKVNDREEPIYDLTTGKTEVKLSIGKNRNGAAGNPLYLDFEGRCQRYTESMI